MKDEATAGFDRAAKVDPDLLDGGIRVDAELGQQVREGDRADQAVDHQAHGPVGVVGANVNDGPGESRIAHIGHRNQELAGQIVAAIVRSAVFVLSAIPAWYELKAHGH